MGDTQIFLYSIKSFMIVGIAVDEKRKNVGHKLMHDIVAFMEDELENVVEWSESY
jgi:ribosomal protein L13E